MLCTGAVRLHADAQSCESSPAVEAAQWNLDQKLEGATFEQSISLQDQAYPQMMGLDPLDYRPARWYIQHIRYDEPEQWDALREKFVSGARAHPDDPVKLVLAAVALKGRDTPLAFQFLDQAVAANPNYAPTYIQLNGHVQRFG